MSLRTLLRIAHTGTGVRVLLKTCAVIFVAYALSGFTFLNDPLIENGERVPIAGSYECKRYVDATGI
jgi:hypothetical protein